MQLHCTGVGERIPRFVHASTSQCRRPSSANEAPRQRSSMSARESAVAVDAGAAADDEGADEPRAAAGAGGVVRLFDLLVANRSIANADFLVREFPRWQFAVSSRTRAS